MLHRIAIIPARGGSKGIVNKNVSPLAGKPLLQYAVDAALATTRFDTVYVSSDSEDILALATRLGATAVRRPQALAGDDSPTADAISHLLQSEQVSDDTAIALLQPTSPLRQAEHIAAALALHEAQGQAVLGINSEPTYPSKYVALGPDNTVSSLGDPAAPRQALQPAYKPNGAIYIFTRLQFQQAGGVPVDGAVAFPMSPVASLDIDTGADLKLASLFLDNLDVLDL